MGTVFIHMTEPIVEVSTVELAKETNIYKESNIKTKCFKFN